MNSKKPIQLDSSGETWGGIWTEKKLSAFGKYVWSYLTILRRFPKWKTIYFDGFAGSGARKEKKSELYRQLSIAEDDENIYKERPKEY